jgi:hypothetical protein
MEYKSLSAWLRRISLLIDMKKYIQLFFICTIVCSSVACQSRIYKLQLRNNNPVEFVYKIQKDSLYNLLTNKHSFLGMDVFTIQNKRIIPPEISSLYILPENSKDVYFQSFGIHNKSKIYCNKQNEFCDYWDSYYLHLDAITVHSTKVTVTTIKSEIIIGQKLLPSPPHFVRDNKTITVEPSTIEEYLILLEIGKMTGENNMPKLILPDSKNKSILKID